MYQVFVVHLCNRRETSDIGTLQLKLEPKGKQKHTICWGLTGHSTIILAGKWMCNLEIKEYGVNLIVAFLIFWTWQMLHQ